MVSASLTTFWSWVVEDICLFTLCFIYFILSIFFVFLLFYICYRLDGMQNLRIGNQRPGNGYSLVFCPPEI